jgi:putative oxidoreductase
MTSFNLTPYISAAILLLRLMVAAVFISSGWGHASQPEKRGQSIGQSKGFTLFLGVAEICGRLAITIGFLTQAAALGLILVLLGAIYKKIAVWHTGFWGENASGWHYDLILIVMNLIVLVTNGGAYVVTH